jgi:hypothetical protein
VVNESDVAYHAGHSVWADRQRVYVDLNNSFLGIALEAESGKENAALSPAQIRSAAILVEMLRSKYGLAEENCVTHAQVSINPSNSLIGYHTDWSVGFPFSEIGLRDNYRLPPASVYLFGFDSDASLRRASWPGLADAEKKLREAALAGHLSLSDYRRGLQKRYREQLALLSPFHRSHHAD